MTNFLNQTDISKLFEIITVNLINRHKTINAAYSQVIKYDYK